MQSEFRGCSILEPNELISGVLEEVSFADTIAELEKIVGIENYTKSEDVRLHSVEMYELIAEFERALDGASTARVDTKYKIVAKKVKSVAAPLPEYSNEVLEKVSKEQL